MKFEFRNFPDGQVEVEQGPRGVYVLTFTPSHKSISEDLCRLRRVIHQHGKHMRKLASRIDAPVDMRGALADFADTCNEVLAEVPQSECEAKLSKAIDLLKECQASGIDPHSPFGARVAAFLKEVSE